MRRWELEQIKKGGADLKEVKARQAAARVRDKLKKGEHVLCGGAEREIGMEGDDRLLKQFILSRSLILPFPFSVLRNPRRSCERSGVDAFKHQRHVV